MSPSRSSMLVSESAAGASSARTLGMSVSVIGGSLLALLLGLGAGAAARAGLRGLAAGGADGVLDRRVLHRVGGRRGRRGARRLLVPGALGVLAAGGARLRLLLLPALRPRRDLERGGGGGGLVLQRRSAAARRPACLARQVEPPRLGPGRGVVVDDPPLL